MIRVLSGYGYGICCDFGGGYIRFKRGSETIYEFTDFGRRAYQTIYTTSSLAPFDATYEVFHETDDADNGVIKVLPSGGLPAYRYSNDCGDTPVLSNIFEGLSAGLYCMVTRDTLGQTVIDTIEVQNITNTENIGYGHARMSAQPNPAKDAVSVSLYGVHTDDRALNVQLLDATGRSIKEIVLTRQGSLLTGSVSLADLPAGVYVLRSQYAPSIRLIKQ
jgi:hypothetical protein